MKGSTLLAGVVGTVMAAAAAMPAWGHEIVFEVGHTSAGQLKSSFDFDEPVVLPVSIFPGFTGYADGEPAFHSVALDDAAEDLFVPSTLGNYRFVLVSHDAGIDLWGGTSFLAPGGFVDMGPAPFDDHPLWNLFAGAVPGQAYSVTLKVQDTSGIYTESDPFTVAFTAVPEPGMIRVGGAAMTLMALRRRR